jgi:uncharacterized RDD family membrane protein YckC
VKEESDLITGEAVVVDLRIARLASRGLAMMLDVALQVVTLLIILLIAMWATPSADSSLILTIVLSAFVLVMVGYPVLFETLSRGRTLGKMALGLRVVRADGGPIRFRHALTRALCGVLVDFWLLGFGGAIAVVVSLLSGDGKRVGDYLAGTVVIRERVPDAGMTSAIQMPAPLAQWASQLDLSGLPDDLALAVRQFLGRMHELRLEAADSLGYSLAMQVGARIGTPCPPNVPAWAYLSAVLAERRSRDHARAFGQPGPEQTVTWPTSTYVHPPPGTTPPPGAVPAPTDQAPAPENPFAPPG